MESDCFAKDEFAQGFHGCFHQVIIHVAGAIENIYSESYDMQLLSDNDVMEEFQIKSELRHHDMQQNTCIKINTIYSSSLEFLFIPIHSSSSHLTIQPQLSPTIRHSNALFKHKTWLIPF